MKVLLLTQYYPPETGAPQNRLSRWVRYLASKGHEVTVLTGMPNYPGGRIFDNYRGRIRLEEQQDGARIVRTWLYATKSRRFALRMINYLSFVATSAILGAFKTGHPDVVIVESPPLFLGLSGMLIARLRRARLVFNVSDLWPESVVALGMARDGLLIRAAVKLEEMIYRGSALITGQTEGIVENIASRFPSKRVMLLTNGVAVDQYENARSTNGDASENGSRRFTVGYTGLHGLAQGLDVVLRAAQILSPYPEIRFEFFGDGPDKPRLEELAREMRLTNITMHATRPSREMPALIGGLDAFVVPLRKADLFKGARPSKMFEGMAAGVPIVLSVDGEAKRLLQTADAGVYVEPENAEQMATAILSLYRDRAEARRLGANGRDYVMQNHDSNRISEVFERELLAVCGQERGAAMVSARAGL